MLLGAVLLWALNVTVTKYMLEHGWQPLAYGTIRYFAAIALFWVFTWLPRALVPDRTRGLAIRRHRGGDDLREPALLRLQPRVRARLDGRRSSSGRARCSSGLISIVFLRAHLRALVLDRRRADLRRRRPDRRRRRRRARLGLEGRPARDRARRYVGGLHHRDRPADAPLLAVSDQRGRARHRLGAARAREHPADHAARTSPSLERSGSASSTP